MLKFFWYRRIDFGDEKQKMRRFNLLINRVLHLFQVRRIGTKERIVFLTFDDGPESGITEFVLDELQKHAAKATFFCRGDNAVKYPELLERIEKEGHALGNHTYSHINGLQTTTSDYVADVERADAVVKTHLFRPPWGSISLSSYLRLCRKYKMVYWSLMSGDTALDMFDKQKSLSKLKSLTQKGDIVLFHCCKRHEKETRQLLPDYLDWLSAQGYRMDVMR